MVAEEQMVRWAYLVGGPKRRCDGNSKRGSDIGTRRLRADAACGVSPCAPMTGALSGQLQPHIWRCTQSVAAHNSPGNQFGQFRGVAA
jgi:hypothetical protein